MMHLGQFVAAVLTVRLPVTSRAPTELRLIPRSRCSPPCAMAVAASFDEAMAGMLGEIEAGRPVGEAVGIWLERLDDMFLPTLANRIEASAGLEPEPHLSDIMKELQIRSQQRFERARDQLEELLASGEINRMDAALCKLVRQGDLDAGFLYVLYKNMEDASASGDESTLRVLSHLHTRTQEELEKQADPALALLHKLTRTSDTGVRSRILHHYLVPQSSVQLPDGSQLPLTEPTPAQVSPMAFAGAVEGTVNKVLSMPLNRDLLTSTAEEVRQVAKEARAVIEVAYPTDVLDAFSEALTPVFAKVPRE
mmetsp:Transcript_28978/g.48105  ORF Transcript_28978/g.48105 Transcript_28978/m.48105 type:complete len:309 (-) Transcript_28978:374-1300(-)